MILLLLHLLLFVAVHGNQLRNEPLELKKDADLSLTRLFDQNYGSSGAILFSRDDEFAEITLGDGTTDGHGGLWARTSNPHSHWQARLSFTLRGDPSGGGDGLAFWYHHNVNNETELHSPEDQSVFGGPDRWNGLAVLVDTWDNDGKGNNPAVLAFLNNGSYTYDHAVDGENQYANGCLRSRLRNKKIRLRISYFAGHLRIEINDQGKEVDDEVWTRCLETKATLEAGGQFGVSFGAAAAPVKADQAIVHSLEIYYGEIMKAGEESMNSTEGDVNATIPLTIEQYHLASVLERMLDVRFQELQADLFVKLANTNATTSMKISSPTDNILLRMIEMQEKMQLDLGRQRQSSSNIEQNMKHMEESLQDKMDAFLMKAQEHSQLMVAIFENQEQIRHEMHQGKCTKPEQSQKREESYTFIYLFLSQLVLILGCYLLFCLALRIRKRWKPKTAIRKEI